MNMGMFNRGGDAAASHLGKAAGGAPSGADRIAERQEMLVATLRACEQQASVSDDLLDGFISTLADYKDVTYPIHARVKALSRASANLESVREHTAELQKHLLAANTVREQYKRIGREGSLTATHDLTGFLRAVDDLEAALKYLQSRKHLASVVGVLGMTQSMYRDIMDECLSHFTQLLQRSTIAPKVEQLREIPEDGQDLEPITTVQPEAVPQLRHVAARMLQSKDRRCLDEYVSSRTEILDRVLRVVGANFPRNDQVQAMPFSQQSKLIQAWNVMMYAFTELARAERQLAGEIFFPPYSTSIYEMVVEPWVLRLTSFGRAVGLSNIERKLEPDKMFALVDMIQLLQRMSPKLEVLLAGPHQEEISNLKTTLKENARTIFQGIERAVQQDALPVDTQQASVHPLCAYVLRLLKKLFKTQAVASIIFPTREVAEADGDEEEETEAEENLIDQAAMAAAVTRIMRALRTNLEKKAAVHKGDAIAGLFLVNNLHFMLHTVESTPDMRKLLGEEWVSQQHQITRSVQKHFVDSTWGQATKALMVLPGADESKGLKLAFKNFNSAFTQCCEEQAHLSIPKPDLREELKRQIINCIVPRYRAFHAKHAYTLNQKRGEKYLKYSLDEVQDIIHNRIFVHQVLRGEPLAQGTSSNLLRPTLTTSNSTHSILSRDGDPKYMLKR